MHRWKSNNAPVAPWTANMLPSTGICQEEESWEN
jgi:hypothetical protein